MRKTQDTTWFFLPCSWAQAVCPPRVGPEGRIPVGLQPGGALLIHLQAPAQGWHPAALHLLPPGPRGEWPGRWYRYLSPWVGECHWEASSRAHCSLPWGGSIPGWRSQGAGDTLMLLPHRPQTECIGVLRGHGIRPLQRALHPSCLSGEQVSAKQEGPGAHRLPAWTKVE